MANEVAEIRSELEKLMFAVASASLPQADRVTLSDLIVDCYIGHIISRAEYQSLMAAL